MKIVAATPLTDDSLDILRAADDVALVTVEPTRAAIRSALADASALIVREDVDVDAALMDAAPDLRIIARLSVNISGIDLETATRRGVMVMNAPGVSAVTAAEYTFALILAISRDLVAAHFSLLDAANSRPAPPRAGVQLHGRTLGVIGLGRVGRLVAQRALAFGMTVSAYDAFIDPALVDERIMLKGLRELLAESDFISVHLPATRETRGLINAERLGQMKRGAFLINKANASLIDEEAVAAALDAGRLMGVAVDGLADRGGAASPLLGRDRVIHTPHIGDDTVEANQDLSLQVVRQALDSLRGMDYRNVINMPMAPGVAFETIRPYMILAERMGVMLYTLSRQSVKKVSVEFQGDEVSALVKPLTVALLKGFLTPALGDSVSYVNAPALASQRGIAATQVKGLNTGHFANLVSCEAALADDERILMAGVLLDHQEPTIVQVNDYRLNFVPEGHLLIIGSYDKPGVIGRVGMFMADNQLNIAGWYTGRAQPGGQTLSVLTLDEAPPDTALEALRAMSFIRHAHYVHL